MVLNVLTGVGSVLFLGDPLNTTKFCAPNNALAKVKSIVISKSGRPAYANTCITTNQ